MSDVTSRPWWRWMDGMRYRYHDLDEWDRVEVLPDGRIRQPIGAVPDETDPATLGCLTQRARDLWGDPTLSAWRSECDEVWYVRCRRGYMTCRGPTEFAALLAACDAAPVNTKEGP